MKKIVMIIFFLGISIGLILSSSINLLTDNTVKIKEEKEKNIARQEKIIKEKKDQKAAEKPKTVQQNTAQQPQTQQTPSATVPPANDFVVIRIEGGFTLDKVAEILYANGLINNKEDFKALSSSMNLASKIRIGDKTIKKGSSMVQIISIITT